MAQQLDSQVLGDGIELFQIRPTFYVLTGAGANVGVQVGSDGAVVVDAGDAAHADRVAAEIKKLATRPIRYVINTSADPDHVGGNQKVARAGKTLLLLAENDPFVAFGKALTNDGAAAIMAAEGVLLRMNASTEGTAAVNGSLKVVTTRVRPG